MAIWPLVIGTFGYLGKWPFGSFGIWACGYLGTLPFRHMAIWAFEHSFVQFVNLGVWAFVHLGI